MIKKLFITILMIILMLSICKVTLAVDTYNTTSTINDVEVKWEYQLNNEDKIINLNCKNPGDLKGNITVPSTLVEKQVISIGANAFENAKAITGVTISDGIKEIGANAFKGCENLENVSLGKAEDISFDAFKNCPKLKNITIPKTMSNGAKYSTSGVFTGTTKLTSMTFENGLTVIPAGIMRSCTEIKSVVIPSSVTQIDSDAFRGSGLTEINLPSNVKSIESEVFASCENLENVNLGRVERISINAFKDCPKLNTITIPNTLTDTNYLTGVFTGTTKLSSVTIEDGITTIPGGLFKECKYLKNVKIPDSVTVIEQEAFCGSGITEIVIPSSVKELSYEVFKDCESLESADLGKIESISFRTFENCPKLKSITIPKTLKSGPVTDAGVFTGTTKLTSVIFEEGTTIIPNEILLDCSEIKSIKIPNSVTTIRERAFKGTGISEIDIPVNVETIEYSAFDDCTNLVKITILDKCTSLGFFTLYPNRETVFANHNKDLTIYCYEGSVAAKYAINNNIKYVYLTKPAGGEGSDKQPSQNPQTPSTNTGNGSGQSGNGQQGSNTKDPTTAQGLIPQTGDSILIIASIITTLGFSIVLYKLKKKNEF